MYEVNINFNFRINKLSDARKWLKFFEFVCPKPIMDNESKIVKIDKNTTYEKYPKPYED